MFDEEKEIYNPDMPGGMDAPELLGVGKKEEPKIDPEQEEIKAKLERYEKLHKYLGEEGVETFLEEADAEQAELERRLKEDPAYAEHLRRLVTKVDIDQLRSRDEENVERALNIIREEYPHLQDHLLEVQLFWQRANRINPRGAFDENLRIAAQNTETYLGLQAPRGKTPTGQWVQMNREFRSKVKEGRRAFLEEKQKGE